MSPKYPRWLNEVRVGDVLRDSRGNFRVVREAHVSGSRCSPNRGLVTHVTFTIKHCSWTGRCSTCINFTDIVQRGFQPTGIRVKLHTDLDKKIAADISIHDGRRQLLGCCDVRGIA